MASEREGALSGVFRAEREAEEGVRSGLGEDRRGEGEAAAEVKRSDRSSVESMHYVYMCADDELPANGYARCAALGGRLFEYPCVCLCA